MPTNLHCHNWTDEDITQLTALWSEGQSSSQIAVSMGRGLSRNAIIGKCHRLGLRCTSQPKSEPRKRNPDVNRPRKNTQPEFVVKLNFEDSDELTELPADVSEHAIPFLAAGRNQCRWPLWDDTSLEKLVCGAPKLGPGYAYCDRHQWLSTHKPMPNVPAAVRAQRAAWARKLNRTQHSYRYGIALRSA